MRGIFKRHPDMPRHTSPLAVSKDECLRQAKRVGDPESIFQAGNPGRYVVNRALRETILFLQHNLITDPPFLKIDLISCRNFLIYLKPDIQRKLLKMFHFALRPGGYLFLGKSESTGSLDDLFEPVSAQSRIYRSKDNSQCRPVPLPLAGERTAAPRTAGGHSSFDKTPVVYSSPVRELLLQQHPVAAILIDGDGHALYFFGPTELNLLRPQGEATPVAESFKRSSTALQNFLESQRCGRSFHPNCNHGFFGMHGP